MNAIQHLRRLPKSIHARSTLNPASIFHPLGSWLPNPTKVLASSVKQAILLCLLVPTAFSLNAQSTLTLKECLAQVRETSPESRQIKISDQQGALQQQINTLSYLPQFNINGKATWQSDVTSIGVKVPGLDIPIPDRDQYAVSLDLTQNIYNGGVASARKAVIEKETALSGIQYSSGIHRTEEIATDLFFQIALQQQLIQTSDLQIDRLNQILSTLELHLESGVIDKQSVLSTKVRLKETMQKREEAIENKKKFSANLSKLMGNDNIDIEVTLPSTQHIVPEGAQFEARSDVQRFEAQSKLLDVNDHYNKTQYNPRVALFGSLGYGKPGLNFLNDAFDMYATAGVSLHIPLSQAYTRKSAQESRLLQMQKESLALSKEKYLRDLHMNAQQRLSEIDKLELWLHDDYEIVEMRREIADVVKAKYEGGVITITDYLSEVIDLSLAEEQEATHRVMLEREKALLEQLYGIH